VYPTDKKNLEGVKNAQIDQTTTTEEGGGNSTIKEKGQPEPV